MRTAIKVAAVLNGAAPIGFLPTDISTLAFLKTGTGFYKESNKATPATANDDPVGAWEDQSTSGNDFIQATANRIPVLKTDIIGTKPAVYFDGSRALTRASAMDLSGGDKPFTICFVVKPTALTGTPSVVCMGNSGNTQPFFRVYYDAKFNLNYRGDTGEAQLLSNGTTQSNNFEVHTVISNGTYMQLRVNGAVIITETAQRNTAATLNQSSIGALWRTSLDNFFTGYVAGLSWHPFAVGVDDLYNLESYWCNIAGVAAPTKATISGIWSFFGKPQTIRYAGTKNKTYIGVTTPQRQVKLTEFDHDAGKTLYPVLVHTYTGIEQYADDHNPPQILIRNDGKLMAFYCYHIGTELFQRISTNVEDASAWEAETDLASSIGGLAAYTYPSPIQLTGEVNNPIYLFFRQRKVAGGDYQPTYFSKSVDGGGTWSAAVELFEVENQRPYFQICNNGNDRIDFAETDGHPAQVNSNSIYHYYYQGGNYYQSDGTLIGDETDLPLTPVAVTQVYDGSSIKSWVWDIAIDSTGKPCIVYATFPTAASDHRYNFARWTGSAWESHEICTAGGPLYADEKYYSGGICLDHDNVNTVYCSRNTGSQWEIYKYTTADNGATWTLAEQLTNSSTSPNFRPQVPINSASDLKVIWASGTYTTYQSFLTNLKSNPQY